MCIQHTLFLLIPHLQFLHYPFMAPLSPFYGPFIAFLRSFYRPFIALYKELRKAASNFLPPISQLQLYRQQNFTWGTEEAC